MFDRLRGRPRPAPAASRDAPVEIAAAESRILQAGSRFLAYAAGAGSAALVSPEAVALLSRVDGCLPLQQAASGRGDAAAAADELLGRGLLVTRAALVQALRDAPGPDEPPPIAVVAWLTRGRPAALARSIRSFAGNAARHGRVPRWLVFDDGDEHEGARTLEALQPLLSGGNLRLSYCGLEEKNRMAARLTEAARGSVPDETVRFALFGLPGYGTTCGANRNAAMLAAAGGPLLVADDDTVCEPALHPDGQETFSITSQRDPSDVLCFGGRSELLAAIRRIDADFLSAHESALGRTAAAFARQRDVGAVDLSGVSPALADLLVRGGGRVVATTGGVYGDAIVNDPSYLLWLEGEARERIVASEESLRAARGRREVLRCPPRTSIGDSDVLFGASLGLDCREILPPFLPMGRGQDILFALTVHLCLPEALIGRPAVALLHDPVERRTYLPGESPVRGMQAFDFLMVLEAAHAFPAWTRTPEGRLRSLGGGLEELGRLPQAEFVDAVTPVILRARADQLSAAEALLMRYGRAPQYWAREVERSIERRQEQIAEEPVAPVDVPRTGAGMDAIGAFQTQVRLYGALLQAWPEIWRAAREAAADGPWGVVDLG